MTRPQKGTLRNVKASRPSDAKKLPKMCVRLFGFGPASHFQLTTPYHLIDKAPEWSSAIATSFAFAIRGRMLGIGMCTCGLTDFPRISLFAYSARVVAVLIVHVVTNPACTAPARVRAHLLLR